MKLTPQYVQEILSQLPSANRYILAYSGGRDSHVLLDLLVRLSRISSGAELIAVHINHGLQADADQWMTHCSAICRQYGVPIQTIELQLPSTKGESVEARARRARYLALARLMQSGDIVLTAHHQQDQAETVLLQLLRGAGPAGLSAMPRLSELGSGYLARPLLDISPDDIEYYAARAQLDWIEDPSNQASRFDRNFLRNQVIPLLQKRWPALSKTVSRSARYCAENQQLVDMLTTSDLEATLNPNDNTLLLQGLSALPAVRARSLLRSWIRNSGFPVPGSAVLWRLLDEMVNAAKDRNPVVHWPGTEVRRYRKRLYIMRPITPLAENLAVKWRGGAILELPAGCGRLELYEGPGGLCRSSWRSAQTEVRFGVRQQTRLRMAGRGHSTSFKHLFQQFAIPVWDRPRVPLVYLDGELAAVADLCICAAFAEDGAEPGIHFRWVRQCQAVAGEKCSSF